MTSDMNTYHKHVTWPQTWTRHTWTSVCFRPVHRCVCHDVESSVSVEQQTCTEKWVHFRNNSVISTSNVEHNLIDMV